MLAARERATGAQMVVAIFPSLEGENLEDVSIRLAERWRVGQKSLDNGVILVVFVRDRKVRMEVGYGLEGVITDAVAGRIIREVIAPRFGEGRYAAGLEAAADAVFARVETRAGGSPRRAPGGVDWSTWLPLGFVALLIVAFFVGAARQARRAHRFYTAGPHGWYTPSVPIFFPPMGGGGGGGGGNGGFSAGGGGFGGGGASGDW